MIESLLILPMFIIVMCQLYQLIFRMACGQYVEGGGESRLMRLFFNQLTRWLISEYINNIMTLNLRRLMSISTQLTFEACSIIRQNLQDHSFKEFSKGDDDPVTDTDFKIQSMIIKGLKRHFPKLRIIGQESEQYKGQINYCYDNLKMDMLPSNSRIDQQLNFQDSCLWIDPIDCTRGFINGNYQDVTVLIGLSYKKKPQAGIIGTPYKKDGDKKLFEPIVTIGSVNEREAIDFNGTIWKKKEKPAVHNPIIVATSNSRRSKSEENFTKTLRATSVRAGGSGHKAMMVANGEVDAMVYLDSWTHKWDSCAGDAIIKSMGGYFTSPYGVNITYDPNAISTENKQGMIAAIDREIYQKCMDAMAYF